MRYSCESRIRSYMKEVKVSGEVTYFQASSKNNSLAIYIYKMLLACNVGCRKEPQAAVGTEE